MIGHISHSWPLRAVRRRIDVAGRRDALDTTLGCGTLNFRKMARVAVAPQSGFLYNRVQKNANSALITLVHWLETGRKAGVISSRKRVSNLADWPIREMATLGQMPRMVVVRDPFARTLSAFLNKVGTARFRTDVGHMEATPDCFLRFLHWLDDGRMAVNPHWNLQTEELFFPLAHYTDVIRFERLDDELAGFFARLGIDPSCMHRSGAFQRGRSHRTDTNDRLNQFYNSEGEKILQRLFATDFKALGYDPNLAM
jgi:hypothetical protein